MSAVPEDTTGKIIDRIQALFDAKEVAEKRTLEELGKQVNLTRLLDKAVDGLLACTCGGADEVLRDIRSVLGEHWDVSDE
jgi:hypothetical protein